MNRSVADDELAARLLAAFEAGDHARVLALGAAIADPDTFDEAALLRLGFAQQASGRFAAALGTFRTLNARRPQIPAYWNNLGIVARQAGDPAGAEAALRQAIALAPGNAETHYNLGLLYAQQQRWLLARETLLHAVQLAPDFVEARLQAAHACHVCGDTRGAELSLDGAADWPPQPAEQALTLATMLSSLGHADTALHTLARAILPDAAAERATLALRIAALRAGIHERGNRLAQAEAELTQLSLPRLLALPPGDPLRDAGLHVHASVAARQGDPARAAELYARLLDDDHGQPAALASAAFGLATARDRQGRHREAWQALQQAHALQRQFAGEFVPELLREGSQPLELATQRVSPAEHARWNALRAPDACDSPVFVVGFPRSGTTLLEQMLDAHPAFRAMDERAFVYELIKRMQLAGQRYPDDLATLTQGNVDQLRALYAQMVARVVPDRGARQLVDKNPLNMLCLPMIARLYPEARIVLCLRHPCDVLLSCYMQAFRSPAFMVLCSSLERLARGYVDAFEQWFAHVETFAPRVLAWRYESVVTHFDEHVARLGQFLAVDDPTPMARYAEHARAKRFIGTPSYAQVTQQIHRGAIGRWQAYREHFASALPILRPVMERLGYAT